MMKLVAVLNVVAWAGFWAFGYLALSGDMADTNQIMISGALAAIGGGIGIFTFLRCARYCEMTGYAKPRGAAHLTREARDAES